VFPVPGTDRSANWTLSGKQPFKGLAEKFTTGGSYTVIYCVRVRVLEPLVFIAVRETVYVPGVK